MKGLRKSQEGEKFACDDTAVMSVPLFHSQDELFDKVLPHLFLANRKDLERRL